jgi:hypothetical protein
MAGTNHIPFILSFVGTSGHSGPHVCPSFRPQKACTLSQKLMGSYQNECTASVKCGVVQILVFGGLREKGLPLWIFEKQGRLGERQTTSQ